MSMARISIRSLIRAGCAKLVVFILFLLYFILVIVIITQKDAHYKEIKEGARRHKI